MICGALKHKAVCFGVPVLSGWPSERTAECSKQQSYTYTAVSDHTVGTTSHKAVAAEHGDHLRIRGWMGISDKEGTLTQ